MRTHYTLALAALLLLATAVKTQDSDGLVMLPDTVDFGGIPLGGNYFGQIVYFENATGSPVEINSPYISGQPGNPFAWFSNLIGRFTIGDGSSLRYGVRFRPPWEGAFKDDLCVPVAGFSHPCVHLRGRGVAPLRAEVFQGHPASITTYLPNPGYQPLEVQIRSGHAWATPHPSTAVIPPGDSLAVSISIDPSELATGMYRDSLWVEVEDVYFDYVLPFDVEVRGPVSDEDGVQPASFHVGEAYPNPTTGTVTFDLTLDAPARVSVDGYAAQGHRVLGLSEWAYAAGRHVLTVDGAAWAAGA